MFSPRQRTPPFLNKFNVPVEIVQMALKRTGADKYGPSQEFVNVINSLDGGDEGDDKDDEDVFNNEIMKTFDNGSETLNNVNLNDADIEKLQDAIRRAILSKLSKKWIWMNNKIIKE